MPRCKKERKKQQKEMQRAHAVGDGTDVRRMKEDVLHPSENCKGIKRNRSVSEDRVSGQRKTDRAERMRGIKRNRCNQREQAVVAAVQRG